MFSKLLIANRGEIACRIIRTAKRMGIATVAVFSDADSRSPHVAEADDAVNIGPAPASDSYLNIDALLRAARDTGADAVHPGYGFLSENPELPRKLKRAGIGFVGPSDKAIAAMGDKVRAKAIAAKAGVSIIPGIDDVSPGDNSTLDAVTRMGFPVMVKAAAGGGGKGMRIATDVDGLRRAMESASAEAEAAFGDGRIFIEKLVQKPRHIEVQILADQEGNVVHLGERECSIQRRHQKVIEEAPSSALDPATRAAMCGQAISLARAVGYHSAGTVEFVLGPHGAFYFLEMNTRLQVEHPVTEMVTGIDLVEQMIRIAAGEPLPFTQDDIDVNGCAVEARLYAEDPARQFLPSSGRVTGYVEPGDADIRVDSGIVDGSEVTTHYDPMLAKVSAWGADRPQAVDRLSDALTAMRVDGIRHNAAFLSAVVDHERFRTGAISTAFVEEEFPDGFADAPPSEADELAAFRLLAACCVAERANRVSKAANGVERHLAVIDEAGECSVRLVRTDDAWNGELDGRVMVLSGRLDGSVRLFAGEIDGKPFSALIDRTAQGVTIRGRGYVLTARVVPARAAKAIPVMRKPAQDRADNAVLSPMPGLVVALHVAPGDEVKTGDEIAVVEAMKMENILCAEFDGTVAEVHVSVGDRVAVDQPLVTFE